MDRLEAIRAHYTDGTTRAGQQDVMWLVAECERLRATADTTDETYADIARYAIAIGAACRERDAARADAKELRKENERLKLAVERLRRTMEWISPADYGEEHG